MKVSHKDFIKIRNKIIKRMFALDKWRSNHILVKNLESGFPKHEMHKVKLVVNELIKSGFLIVKKSLHGNNVALNPVKKYYIDKIVEAI
jgi:hypothetical protein